jgi:hypothetical protein
MKLYKLVFSLLLLGFATTSQGLTLPDYLTSRYKYRFVEKLPLRTEKQIIIFSCRYFKPEENYIQKRGLQPKYGMFLFIAGTIGDSAFIMPMKSLDEFSDSLSIYRDFLVFVDGHGKTFDQVLERGFELTGRFAINIVLFDWPTDYLTLRKTVINADEVAANFVIAMNKFDKWHKEHYPSASVSAIFHSMGNHILMDVTGKHLLKYMPKDLFSNLILNAAAVKRANYVKWLEKLAIQKRIYITINRNDRTLQGAKVLRAANQLGLGYKGRTADNAKYVDFSQVASTEHNLFLGRSQAEKNNQFIYGFYDQAFHGKEVDFQNETAYQILSPSEISFRFSLK